MSDPILKRMFNLMYPIGSVYISVNNTSPATLFGGTWEQIKDRFLLACGNTYSNGSTGGATSHNHTTGNHQLSVDEMPSHRHDFTNTGRNLMWDSGLNSYGGLVSGDTVQYTWDCNTKVVGGNKSHNHGNTGNSSNMPPYLAVYVWKRTG